MCLFFCDAMSSKRRFWNAEPTFQNAFSKHFQRFVAQMRKIFASQKNQHIMLLVVVRSPTSAGVGKFDVNSFAFWTEKRLFN